MIDAFRIAREEVDATLVLVGNVATGDPEGQQILESLCNSSSRLSVYDRG